MKSVFVRSLLLCAALLGAVLLIAACSAAPAAPDSPAAPAGAASWTPAAVARPSVDPSASPAPDLAANQPTPAALDAPTPASSPADAPTPAPADPPAPTPAPPPAAPPTTAPAGPPADNPVTIGDTYRYRYQGSEDSGACDTANCGPAVFAAAIDYAKGGWTAIKDVRAYLSGKSCRGTDYNDAYRSLDHWGVSYKTTKTMAELKAAVTQRGHPALVILYMAEISQGADYRKRGSDPAQHFGRFHPYTDGHFVVVKGFTEDGQWVIVDDPYVFDGGLGFYSDGTPKGHNRYVKYTEFEKAFEYFGFQGIEIIPG